VFVLRIQRIEIGTRYCINQDITTTTEHAYNNRCTLIRMYAFCPYTTRTVKYIPLSWQRESDISQYAWVHFNNIPFLGNSMYDKFPLATG